VDRYPEPLLALHRHIERSSQPLDVGFHLFLLVAERTSPANLCVTLAWTRL
jgi:hypothetical protein